MQLFDRVAGLAAAGSAATLGALAAAGAVDADGIGSTTEWVKASTPRSGREAARMARLAKALPDLPDTSAALADGALTPEAADAVVSAVRDGRLGGAREVEASLLRTATNSSPERLRSEIRRRQLRADADAMLRNEREIHARRRARMVRHDDGGWNLGAYLTDEVGSRFRGELSPQAVRRLACDATITRIVMSGPSQVLDVGRATRSWSEPQRRAVNARDRHCRGPNCSRPIAWTEIHHVRWWERDRGPTNLDNGLALCHHCHHLVHDRGWTVVLDALTARATWTSPSGRVSTTDPPQSLPPPERR